MRNLGSIANNILKNNDTLEISAKITNMINTNISDNIIYKNIDIRNYLIGVYLYVYEPLLKNDGDNLPLSLTIGKFNLISLSRQSSLQHKIISSNTEPSFINNPISIYKIVINPGFRIKCWTGIFNNLGSDDNLNPPSNLESKYYSPSYDIKTPGIIENNTNNQLIINNTSDSIPLIIMRSIEIEVI
jgi:hypothetical protein